MHVDTAREHIAQNSCVCIVLPHAGEPDCNAEDVCPTSDDEGDACQPGQPGTAAAEAEAKCAAAFSDAPCHICCSCERALFKHSVHPVTDDQVERLPGEWPQRVAAWRQKHNRDVICNTCLIAVRADRMPRFALANGLELPEQPDSLKDLPEVAERLVAQRCPFLQLRQLRPQRGGEHQHGLKGES